MHISIVNTDVHSIIAKYESLKIHAQIHCTCYHQMCVSMSLNCSNSIY
jgi:hypothetical protein